MKKVRKFKVIVTNAILGNSERVMDIDTIRHFNLVAYSLAKKSAANGGERVSSGMWTVEKVDL